MPVLLSPLFLGRVFCGYVCPMGFLVELFGPQTRAPPGPRAREILRKVPLFGLVVVAMLILFRERLVPGVRPALALHPERHHPALSGGRPADHRGRRPPLPHTAAARAVDSVTNFLTGRLVFENGLLFGCRS